MEKKLSNKQECEYKAFRFKCDAMKYAKELAKEHKGDIIKTTMVLMLKTHVQRICHILV